MFEITLLMPAAGRRVSIPSVALTDSDSPEAETLSLGSGRVGFVGGAATRASQWLGDLASRALVAGVPVILVHSLRPTLFMKKAARKGAVESKAVANAEDAIPAIGRSLIALLGSGGLAPAPDVRVVVVVDAQELSPAISSLPSARGVLYVFRSQSEDPTTLGALDGVVHVSAFPNIPGFMTGEVSQRNSFNLERSALHWDPRSRRVSPVRPPMIGDTA